ncbi:hypothetical protein OTB20_34260 [Streptomyces sp. H27-H1]|uniref:hypothetical protein n=1 Tax=unclassified Streptomyces TaxID=2593676 RepID=UPI0022717483|nr:MULTISPECIES: hypothetical protein [unclassified Streptomyces]MCY0931160.1 hypothetical protein [Streptomyces sp. H27-H1]MCY0939245.1 hypothetical protein [Streptomyces sp. H34-S4]
MPEHDYLSRYLQGLPPTTRNLTSAAVAFARIDELGWAPRAGYPGSDVLWPVHCLLCGWQGLRFYSHLRRDRPSIRHTGCAPKATFPALLKTLASTETDTCRCSTGHAATAEQFLMGVQHLLLAHQDDDHERALDLAGHLLGPCTAAARRAQGALAAFPRT